jgi:Predicted transcriptional regulators
MKKTKGDFKFGVDLEIYLFVEKLVGRRKLLDMTQDDVADKTGLTQQTISRLETHFHAPTLTNLIKYMGAVGLDINKVF